MSSVLTIGTFDLFHSGHVELLKKCRKIVGDEGMVNVGINSDEFVRKYKKFAPVMDYANRSCVVAACKYVDLVYENKDNGRTLISHRKPNFLVVGSDWALKDYFLQIDMTFAELEKQNTTLLYVDYTQGISSTMIRNNIKSS